MDLKGMRLFFTVFQRPEYFEDTLNSWANVRGIDQIPITFHLEPSKVQDIQVTLIREFTAKINNPDVKVLINDQVLGVLRNPFNGFTFAFDHVGTEYVIIAEEDLLVSSDILEYHAWARNLRTSYSNLGAVLSYERGEDRDSHSSFSIKGHFSPLVWGTWKDVWLTYIAPTWDFTYESGIVDGVDTGSGWDHHLNKRIFPRNGLKTIVPYSSRSQHIGVWGQHSLPELFITSNSFVSLRPTGIEYRII